MKYNKILILTGFGSFLLLLSSCGIYDGYFSKVKNNIDEFSSIVNYVSSNRLFELNDSINKQNSSIYNIKNISLYRSDIKDSVLVLFMNKYNIDRITFQERNDNFYHSVIIFHKDYNPIIGKSKTIDFDFGVSPLRNRIENGQSKEGSYSLKIINADFIYSVNKKPSFGE
jgi:hypothetical protein